MRLQRTGRRNEPTFRLVVTDKRNGPKSGRFVDILGSYDPRIDLNKESFKLEKISEWLSKGVQPSETVHNLLINLGVIKGDKINVLPQKAPIKKEEEAKEEKPAEENSSSKSEAENTEDVASGPAEEDTEESDKKESTEETKEETAVEEKKEE